MFPIKMIAYRAVKFCTARQALKLLYRPKKIFSLAYKIAGIVEYLIFDDLYFDKKL